MISNPSNASEFAREIEAIARRDVDVLVVGNTVARPNNVSLLEETGHSVYLESSCITLPLLAIQSVRLQSPARYEYYRNLLTGHPGSTLPRSKAIQSRNAGRLVAINAPSTE